GPSAQRPAQKPGDRSKQSPARRLYLWSHSQRNPADAVLRRRHVFFGAMAGGSVRQVFAAKSRSAKNRSAVISSALGSPTAKAVQGEIRSQTVGRAMAFGASANQI